MLDAFATRLRSEVEKPSTSLIRYLARFVPPDRVESALREVPAYVLKLPDNIMLLNSFLLSRDTPLVVKMFYASVLAYLLNPEDFLPERKYGLYGYLDDAYLVVAALQRTIPHIPRTLRDKHQTELKRLEELREETLHIREYLPPVVLEKLVAALDSFETAAFIICDQSTFGEVKTIMDHRFSCLSEET